MLIHEFNLPKYQDTNLISPHILILFKSKKVDAIPFRCHTYESMYSIYETMYKNG